MLLTYLTAVGLTLVAAYNAFLAYQAYKKREGWKAILSLGTVALLVVGAYHVVVAS